MIDEVRYRETAEEKGRNAESEMESWGRRKEKREGGERGRGRSYTIKGKRGINKCQW